MSASPGASVATVVKPDDDEEVEGEEDEVEDAERNGSVAELANPEDATAVTTGPRRRPPRQRKTPVRASQLSANQPSRLTSV